MLLNIQTLTLRSVSHTAQVSPSAAASQPWACTAGFAAESAFLHAEPRPVPSMRALTLPRAETLEATLLAGTAACPSMILASKFRFYRDTAVNIRAKGFLVTNPGLKPGCTLTPGTAGSVCGPLGPSIGAAEYVQQGRLKGV